MKLKKFKIKKWMWGVIIVVLAGAVFAMMNMSKGALEVEQTTVLKGALESLVEEKAEVRLRNMSTIYAGSAGVVTSVEVAVGDAVEVGAVLLRMDDASVKLQIKDLEAQIKGAEARYAEANTPANQTEIAKLQAQFRSAQTLYDEAKRKAEGNKLLYETGGISFDVYQATLADQSSKEATLLIARSNLSLAREGMSDNVKKQYDAMLSELRVRKDLLEKQLDDLTVEAKVDGTVLTLAAEVDAYVAPGMPLIEIGNTTELYLVSDVLVEDVVNIQVGQSVRIEQDDMDLADLMGTVEKIHPVAFGKPSELGIIQKRVTVEIAIPVTNTPLKSGYEVTAYFITAQREGILLLDKKAIFTYEGKDHVFVNKGGIATLTPITIGLKGETHYEVSQGLVEGDQVVLSPDEDLAEGIKIVAK